MDIATLKVQLTRAAQLDLPYRLMGQSGDTHAAVLVAWAQNSEGGASVLLTQRTHSLETHKGQIAFPGGVLEPGESPSQAALRETLEEVGIDPSDVCIHGELPEFFTSTGFKVTPVLATLTRPISQITLTINRSEIDTVFWASYSELINDGVYRLEPFQKGAIRVMTDVFQVREHRVWGATGGLLKNVLDRLRSLK